MVWLGLVNLQYSLAATILDIVNQPGLQSSIISSLTHATAENLNVFVRTPEWEALRSSCLESIRLSGPILGPARLCNERIFLPSDPRLSIPKGQVATLSAYYTHRQTAAWGERAAAFDNTRFAEVDPPIGEPNFISWGLKGPHICPGRWFAVSAISIMAKVLLEEYEFEPEKLLADDEK